MGTWSNIMCMRIFRSDKLATTAISRTILEALYLCNRAFFRENRSKFLTFIARYVSCIVCETNQHWRSEILSETHTYAHTHNIHRQFPAANRDQSSGRQSVLPNRTVPRDESSSSLAESRQSPAMNRDQSSCLQSVLPSRE